MKKLIYVLAVACLFACTKKPKNTPQANRAEPPKISFNGISESDSKKMIKDYLKDQISSDKQTSIWFSIDFLDELMKVDTTTVKGVRIHLAKRYGKNTVVLLLTTDGGPSRYAPAKQPPTKRIHTDFFSVATEELSSTKMKNVDEHTAVLGADLYLSQPPTSSTCIRNPNHIDAITAYKWVNAFIKGQTPQKEVINLTSMWYPIGLFHLLRKEMELAQKAEKKTDGFRIYFAKKENGEHALVLVPTTDIGNGNHQDDYNCYLVYVRDLYDRGEECPTFCEGIDVP